jgi:4-hydroxy-tetrahydrodipicolinate reductase
MNQMVAKMMSDHEEYEVSIDETHHTEKVDTPSGTAIRLAEDVADNMERKDLWVKGEASKGYEIGVSSHRVDQTPGTHVVKYSSAIDDIQIKHIAKSRVGFAKGAVLAAEWVNGRKGLYTMDDLLKDVNFAGFWQ